MTIPVHQDRDRMAFEFMKLIIATSGQAWYREGKKIATPGGYAQIAYDMADALLKIGGSNG